MRRNKSNNTIKFQKDYKFNIGIVIVIIIFIYVLFHVFSYLTDKNIKVYEVKEGTISDSIRKDALILRNEEVYNADSNGTIKYFKQDSSRVGMKSIIYSIDSTGEITNKINSINTDINKLPDSVLNPIYNEIDSFVEGYSNSNFIRSSILKNNLSSSLDQIHTSTALDSLEQDIRTAHNNGTYSLYPSPKAGLFMLTLDGFEELVIR